MGRASSRITWDRIRPRLLLTLLDVGIDQIDLLVGRKSENRGEFLRAKEFRGLIEQMLITSIGRDAGETLATIAKNHGMAVRIISRL